tara:strand:- start:10685 stop:12943 length:2259 start_codon:yes stop_codon:yes gene_type:complete
MTSTADNKLMVSMYQDFKNNLGERNLLELLQEIKSDKYQSEINSFRYALHKEEINLAAQIKNSLLGFTTSATFNDARLKENLVSYTQVLCLDFDHIPKTEIYNIKGLINDCEYTFASFISPSGEGIKTLIKVNSNAEIHTIAYNQVANFYKELSGYAFDAKCKDITRLCFVSCDIELYLNENATTFEVKEQVKSIKTEPQKEVKHNLTTDELLDKCLAFTENKEQYYNGNRNNFIYLFSCNANKFGINEDDTLNYCINNFDLEEREIKATVKSAYKNHIADFATFAKFANMQSTSISNTLNTDNKFNDYEDCLKTTPTIPLAVYENLPPILHESCQVFTQDRERDTFLTGALAILSGCLPNVSGVYSGNTIYPSLFSFVLAPAASGKGALKFAKALADKYHDKTLAESLEEKKQYEESLAAYKMLKNKNKLEEGHEMPQAPKFKVVFIPANTSNAKIIQHLDWNEGKGIICETEADTLGQTFKNEWGAYSDMLRKSFHHEKISKSIKTDGEYIEVNNPQLSVALSGTPKQVFNIISSAEDGLFSRFIFYVFKTDAVWLDPSPKGNPVNLTDYFATQSKKVLKLVEYFETNEMILNLTDEQWGKFNPVFSTFLEQINTFVSEDALSIVKRLGLILYRFCMIFTAIRKFEARTYQKEVYCSDIDFETALTLTKTYIQHSVIMFTNLPKQKEQDGFKSGQNKKQFLEALPKSFQRKEAVEIGLKFNLKERSVDGFLKSCLGKYLTQPKTGFYEKF